MAVIDYFSPNPSINCPRCEGLVEGWQGKPPESSNRTWRQCSDETGLTDETYLNGGRCIECGYSFSIDGVAVIAVSENGKWVHTTIEPYNGGVVENGSWVKCQKCLNFWEGTQNKTYDICPSCKTVVQIIGW